MSKSEYITFGTTEVHLASVVTMSEEEFKSIFRGKVKFDINDAWNEVLKHKPKETFTKKKKKKYFKSED